MQTRVKPGDLAYLVHSNIPENLGIVVEVLELDAFYTVTYGRVFWLVKTREPAKGTHPLTGTIKLDTTHVAEDAALRKINGPPLPEEDEPIVQPVEEHAE